jgi:hypothetical protein
MNFPPIVSLLQSAGVGVPGTSLFTNEMPSECRNGILLLDSYGGTPIDHYLPGYKRCEFRVTTRAIEQVAGMTFAKKVSDVLTVHQPKTLPGMILKLSLPQNEPRPYRRSVGGYWEFEVEVDVTYVDA